MFHRSRRLENSSPFHQFVEAGESDALFVSVKYRESEEEVGHRSFAYWRVVDGLPVHKLFLRDPYRTHYHHGIPRLGSTIYDIRDQVLACIRARGVRRMVVLGASQGGYMALVLAKRVGVAEPALAIRCLAYDPQTRLRYRDSQAAALYRWGYIQSPSPTPELMNVQALFRRHPPRSHRQKYLVLYGTETEDIEHAQHLLAAVQDPAYATIAWQRRLILRQCRRKHSAHGSQIVRESERGRLRERIAAAFASMKTDQSCGMRVCPQRQTN